MPKVTIRVEIEVNATSETAEGFALESADWIRRGMSRALTDAHREWASYEVKVGKLRW